MRRLNVKLAVWLLGIAVFSVVGVHFLHAYQVKRNAEFLKVQAEQAQKDGDIKKAISQYNQFLRYRDDRDGYKALAELVVKVANEAGATRNDKFRAYNILEEAIRRHEDLDEVRKSLVDYTMMLRRYSDALDHIRLLQDHHKERGEPLDSELEYRAALCHFLSGEEVEARKKLYEIVGYDEATQSFADTAPASAKEIEAFTLLAQILRRNNAKEQADELMRQLVKWNADSAVAHLTRARDVLGVWQNAPESTEEEQKAKRAMLADAKAEMAEAEKLAPNDADVMLTAAMLEMMEQALRRRDGQEGDYAKTQELLDRALKQFPKRQDVYLRRADLALAQNDREKAGKELEQGLKEADDTSDILKQLVEVQFQLMDLKAAKATCEKMRAIDTIPLELIKYQEARLKLSENKIVEGTRELEQVRPAMERLGPVYAQHVNTYLGRCYEMLGRPDKQLEANRRLLAAYPNLLVARVGEAQALQALGRHAEAETSVGLLASGAKYFPTLQPLILQIVVNQQKSKPAEEQNWAVVNEISEMIKQNTVQDPLNQQLLQADLLIVQGNYREALQILSGLRKQNPKDIRIWLALCKAMSADEEYREKLPQLLAFAEKEVGNVPALFTERLRTVVRGDREKAPAALQQLEPTLAQFKEEEQRALYVQLGAAYLQAGDYDNGRRCFMTAMKKDPSNAGLRQLLFEMAMERGDEAGMDEILKELRESPSFGTEDAIYKYCAASRNLARYSLRRSKDVPQGEEDLSLLADARKLIDEAIAQRGEWGPLWRVRGEIEQLSGNVESAINNYQQSLSYMQSNQSTTARRLVTLLYAAKRYTEANAAMKLLSDAEIPDTMRRLVGDNLRRAGNSQEALEMARKDIEKDPQNPSNYIWYAQLLDNLGRTDESEQAYRKATEVGPKLADGWGYYVRRLMANKKKNEAVEAVRQATASLGDNPLALAVLHQQVEDFQQAETLFKKALAEKPGDLMILQSLAGFYLATGRSDEGHAVLDQMVAQAEKSSDKEAAKFVSWARRRKAQSLAQLGGYDHVMQAIAMIEKNAQGGDLAPEDMLGIVALLGERDDPKSRATTIQILEKLRAKPGLNPRQMTALGKLYNASGNWEKARETMVAATSNVTDDPEVFILFAEMSLDHDEVSEATGYADLADALLSKSPAEYPERVRLAARLVRARLLKQAGKTEEAVALMEDLLPRPLPQNQLGQLDAVAKQMEQLGLYEGAERILDEYMSLDPRGAIAMAAFKGRRGDTDKAFALLEESRNSEPAIQVLPVANEILRLYPKAATPERFSMLEEWAKSAAQNQANPQRVKLLLAELYDMQGRYDEVEKIYREVLSDPLTTPEDRARIQNNLAFILAIVNPTPQRGAEALELVEASIRFMGPLSDLLDTRALAHLAQGNAKQAAEDLRLAAADRPTTTKYYHLAKVEKQLGNMDAARSALSKAQELHGEHNAFTPAERKGYEQLVQELDKG
jgi:tetratricopeptide (TPR) repeat protein